MRPRLSYSPVRHTCLAILLLLLAGKPAAPQIVPATVESGTLNLIIANKNGFVIAADSRRSRVAPFAYWDDSQKLFRMGPKAAAVISGFASWAVAGTPIDFQVAAAMRDWFSDPVWIKRKEYFTNLPPAVRSIVAEQLMLCAGILDATSTSPKERGFQVLAAGFDKSELKVLRIEFRPDNHIYGPFDLRVPSYDTPVTSTTVVSNFEYFSAGIDVTAKAILDGQFPTKELAILDYYRARNEGRLDRLPLTELKGLAIAILAETKRATPFVGGPDQVGVFSKHGVEWQMPELPSSSQKLKSKLINIGSSYSWCGFPPDEYNQIHGKQSTAILSYSTEQPLEEPFIQVFMGGIIRDVPVSLDGNIFAGNRFENVRFQYAGGLFYLDGSNAIEGCTLETAEGVDVPDNGILKQCSVERVNGNFQANTVGARVFAKAIGCFIWSNGRMKTITTGHRRGMDCKGSHVEVPKAIGPFELCPNCKEAATVPQ